jgi:hypothetical protein
MSWIRYPHLSRFQVTAINLFISSLLPHKDGRTMIVFQNRMPRIIFGHEKGYEHEIRENAIMKTL